METRLLWKSMVITMIVFFLGIFVGYYLEYLGTGVIKEELEMMNIEGNDAILQTLYFQTFSNHSEFCKSAIKENIAFADKVYEAGIDLERREMINRFQSSLILDKKRYVLLKLQFWFNAIQLKEQCDADYHILVFFYSHYTTNSALMINQKTQGNVVMELKWKCGDKMMLIPLPSDLDITTIDMIKEQYGIATIPTILIDQEIKLEGLQTLADLEEYIQC